MITTAQTAITLRVLGTVRTRDIRFLLQCNPQTFCPVSLGSGLPTSLSLFLVNSVQPKIYYLLIESLKFIPHTSSAGHFSSPCHTTKFLLREHFPLHKFFAKSRVNEQACCHLQQCPVALINSGCPLQLLLDFSFGC